MKRTLALTVATLTLLIGTTAWTNYRALLLGESVTASAEDFLETLTPEQRRTALMDYDTPQRVDWHFIPKAERKGLQVRDMNDQQREAAHALLQSVLSEAGYDKATHIMQLESLLHELEGGQGRFARDPVRYYFTLFGNVEEGQRWGLSVEGHHLSLNYVIEGGEVVSSTPQVMGANPALVKTENNAGVPVGTRVLAREETLAFELVNSFNDAQQETGIIAAEAPAEVRAAGEAQPPTDPPAGIPASDLSEKQSDLLEQLVKEYCASMPTQIADARLKAIGEAGFDNVHFAWAGPREPGIGHYYRVQGPTFLIEFVNTQPDAAGNPANHIHTIWRDMHGDFALPIE